MHGMVQSLNVSVAAAVILYEALRQRMLKGMYDKPDINNDQFAELTEAWLKK
jgi:tRNA (guanosine-2'-O-)-methyltransferase